ncbi:MAG: hypothetical protein GJ680_18590 [Alteromonadaceae bacterium]|nr:hypothetical protein [Alteromonadaceae bacterium]
MTTYELSDISKEVASKLTTVHLDVYKAFITIAVAALAFDLLLLSKFKFTEFDLLVLKVGMFSYLCSIFAGLFAMTSFARYLEFHGNSLSKGNSGLECDGTINVLSFAQTNPMNDRSTKVCVRTAQLLFIFGFYSSVYSVFVL